DGDAREPERAGEQQRSGHAERGAPDAMLSRAEAEELGEPDRDDDGRPPAQDLGGIDEAEIVERPEHAERNGDPTEDQPSRSLTADHDSQDHTPATAPGVVPDVVTQVIHAAPRAGTRRDARAGAARSTPRRPAPSPPATTRTVTPRVPRPSRTSWPGGRS